MGQSLYPITGYLNPVPPFAWEQSLHFLGGFPPTRGEQRCTAETLTKAVCVAGRTLVFQLYSVGDVDVPRLHYTFFAEQPLDTTMQHAVEDRITFFLGLEDDLRPFYELAQDDPQFLPILRRFYGYHEVKFLTPFENACWAVLGQRVAMPVAQKMKQAITDAWGGSLVIDGVCYSAFPEAHTLAQVNIDSLQEVIHNQRKAEYLAAVAHAFAAVDEQWLRSGPYDEVEEWLRSIKGIGPWSASFVLLRGLGHLERVDLSFNGMADGVSAVYGGKQTELARLAAHYGTYQGYWLHYLKAAA